MPNNIPSPNQILQNRKDIWDAITIVYPVCKQGLELECGNGYKISVGRKRGQNLWGIDSHDYSKEWRENNVSSYCKQMKPEEIYYNEDSVDMVINNNDLNIQTKEQGMEVLKNIKRVCSGKAFLNLPLNDTFSKSWWIKNIVRLGFILECLQTTTANTLVVELQC